MVPNILNTTIGGKEGYATSDLLEPHPTRLGWWKVYGRADDQIMHNTGEKVSVSKFECFNVSQFVHTTDKSRTSWCVHHVSSDRLS